MYYRDCVGLLLSVNLSVETSMQLQAFVLQLQAFMFFSPIFISTTYIARMHNQFYTCWSVFILSSYCLKALLNMAFEACHYTVALSPKVMIGSRYNDRPLSYSRKNIANQILLTIPVMVTGVRS